MCTTKRLDQARLLKSILGSTEMRNQRVLAADYEHRGAELELGLRCRVHRNLRTPFRGDFKKFRCCASRGRRLSRNIESRTWSYGATDQVDVMKKLSKV